MAGVSRSAGIGAALILIFDGSDLPVFLNGRYHPNMKCYRTILATFGFKFTKESIIKNQAEKLSR